jgi:LysM repeat protein
MVRRRYVSSLPTALLGSCVLALAACDPNGNFDIDMRNFGRGGFDTTAAAENATLPRPATDDRGVISYPTYQVVVARRGDTVQTVADRIGMPGAELASYNAIAPGAVLREGEVLALPRRVAGGAPAPAGRRCARAPRPRPPKNQESVKGLGVTAQASSRYNAFRCDSCRFSLHIINPGFGRVQKIRTHGFLAIHHFDEFIKAVCSLNHYRPIGNIRLQVQEKKRGSRFNVGDFFEQLCTELPPLLRCLAPVIAETGHEHCHE